MDAMIDMDEELKLVEECCQKAGLGSIYYQEKRGLIDEWKNILDRLIAAVYGIGYYIENDLDLTFSSRIAEIYDMAVVHDLGDYKTNKQVPASMYSWGKRDAQQYISLTISDIITMAGNKSCDAYVSNFAEVYMEKYNIYQNNAKVGVPFDTYIRDNVMAKSEFDFGRSVQKFLEGTVDWVKEIPGSIEALFKMVDLFSGFKRARETGEFIFNLGSGKTDEEDFKEYIKLQIENEKLKYDMAISIPKIPSMMINGYIIMCREKGAAYANGHIMPDVILALLGTKGADKIFKGITAVDAAEAARIADNTADAAEAARITAEAGEHADEAARIAAEASEHADDVVAAFDGGSNVSINPLDNPNIAKDIVADPDAVYGYVPKEGSSLEHFEIDWTNPEEVAKARAARIEYLEAMEIKKAKISDEVEKILAEGKDMSDAAEIMVDKRNVDRINSYKERGDYRGLESLYERNLAEYGQKEGPSLDYLYKKYGSYEEVIYSSVKVNEGMNVLLGID